MNYEPITKNKLVASCALWIKEYAHALRVLAGLFFVFALISGIAWIAGSDVEPIAYVFGLISSLLFASPSIAEYVMPNRKSVRHMGYDEILEFIKTTDARTDWKWVKTNWVEEAFLKEDPRLRIRVRWDDEGVHVKGFAEPWANKHPDPSANSYWYNLTYEGALIERFILVAVDGARAELPLPDRNTLEVKPLIYKVAQIFDRLNTLDEYMRRSGLHVKSAEQFAPLERANVRRQGGTMRIAILSLGLIILVASCWTPSWAALNYNHNSVKALSKTYGFLLGQEYNLKRIEKAYPALRIQVEAARFTFGGSFAGVKERLEQELIQAMGESNFQKSRGELEKKLTQLLSQQQLTPEIAQQFLGQVKERAKGAEMEVDVFRSLLAVKYAQSPAAELSDGFLQLFSTDGTGKAQGIKLKLQLPQSWLSQEGERPHIVKKWINEGGTGLSSVMLDIRDTEGRTPSAREIEQFVKSGEARQTFTDLGKVYDVGTFTVERLKGYWGELSMIQERVGLRLYQRGMLYQLFFRGKAIGITCVAGASERDSQKADAAAALIKPLCQQVVNSLVLEQAY